MKNSSLGEKRRFVFEDLAFLFFLMNFTGRLEFSHNDWTYHFELDGRGSDSHLSRN
jgi:hypothetical protein